MLKEPTLKRVRKKLEERTGEIKREYETKVKELEEKIEQHKRERDARLVEADKNFHKDFSIAVKWLVGEEDYSWLCEWLMKNREKEIEEAKKKHERKRLHELKNLSAEDYLFYYLNNPEIEQQIKKDTKHSEPEEIKRLTFNLSKLKLEKIREDRTRF